MIHGVPVLTAALERHDGRRTRAICHGPAQSASAFCWVSRQWHAGIAGAGRRATYDKSQKEVITMATPHTYSLKGHLLGACSCDWGCPCSFEARPTQGWCEGSYVWHVEEGHYNGIDMATSTFAMFIKFPRAPHEGNGTGVVLVDAQMP